ncbi:MAG TPA: type II secretion system protein [Epsilonproteobacteria bacterium]|nr:type II secretion system protein [Campylobacterota bacterium]
MINNKTKNAFTLVELLTVIIIMGLIATAALVMLRDTGELKAKQYTTKIMKNIKDAIALQEGEYFSGFMNDFGTMPPNIYFLINQENGANFVAPFGEADTDRLGRFKIKRFDIYDKNDYGGRIIPMPFMKKELFTQERYEDEQAFIKDRNISFLHVGFHGGYLGDGVEGMDREKSIKDGWNMPIQLITELNVTAAYQNDAYLKIKSFGSDRVDDDDESQKIIKDEFDEYKNNHSIKSAFKDDIVMTYGYSLFLPREIKSDVNSTREYAIYSPMLYYVEGSSNLLCTEHNTTHAQCPKDSGNYKRYKAYTFDTNSMLLDNNISWHVGVIKYEIKEVEFFINNQNFTHIITDYNGARVDFSENFYISSGEKLIIRKDTEEFFSKIFPPNLSINISK